MLFSRIRVPTFRPESPGPQSVDLNLKLRDALELNLQFVMLTLHLLFKICEPVVNVA